VKFFFTFLTDEILQKNRNIELEGKRKHENYEGGTDIVTEEY